VAELLAPLFVRYDDLVVLPLFVEQAGRVTRSGADRASHDRPDGTANDGANDSTGDCGPGLLVAVTCGARPVIGLDHFASLDPIVGDGLALGGLIFDHGLISWCIPRQHGGHDEHDVAALPMPPSVAYHHHNCAA